MPDSSVTLQGDYNYQPDPAYTDPMGAVVTSDTSYDPLEIQKMRAALEASKAVPRNRAGQPVELPTLKDFYTPFTEGLFPMLTGAVKGTAASIPGLPGDIESLGRMGLNYLAPRSVNSESYLPNTEDYVKMMPKFFSGPAAHSEKVGEFGGSNIVGGVIDPFAAAKYAPTAGKLAGQGVMKVAEDISSHYGMPSLQPSIMQGEKSSLWNSDLATYAQDLEKKKYDPEIIHALTGTYRGFDQKWRQEIPDNVAQMKIDQSLANRSDLKVRDILQHPKLFEAYPFLGDINLHTWDIPGANGRYNNTLNRIDLNNELLTDPREAKKTLLHELQHAIQHIEKFEKGSNPSMHPAYHIMEDAYELEQIMNKFNVSATDAAKAFERVRGRPPESDQFHSAVELANQGQASLIPFADPTARYRHVAGEMEGDLPGARMDLSEEQLLKNYPLKKDQHGLKLNPENALVQKGVDKKGNPIFITAKELKEQTQRNLDKPTIDQMKAEIKNRQEGDDGWNYAIKPKGLAGNFLDKRLDEALIDFKNIFPPSLSNPINRHELGPNWRAVADRIGYSPEQQESIVREYALNQWVDKRLKTYIMNELATPKDPVRALADQGISHLPNLGEDARYVGNLYQHRKKHGFPEEGYATTNAGKDWENRADVAVSANAAEDFIRPEGFSPSVLRDHPFISALADKDPKTNIYHFDSSRVGFMHLTDELFNAIDARTDLPQHLRITPKDLERMTVPDAVRLVSKINKYRVDLAAKATAKDLPQFRQDFPAIQTFEDGSSWHELKVPANTDTTLPSGFTVKEHPRKEGFYILDNKDHDVGAVGKTPEEAIKAFNTPLYVLDKRLKEEGKLMAHCVGGYTNEVANGDSRIFTLRDQSGKPHATIELQPLFPRNDDIPDNVRAQGESAVDNWLTTTENKPVRLKQIKGFEDKASPPEWRQHIIDFLNNSPAVIRDVEPGDLRMQGIIDTSDTRSVMDFILKHKVPVDVYNQVADAGFETGRFIDSDKFWHVLHDQIKKNNEARKPPEGHKDGGIIRLATGGRIKSLDHDRMKFELMMRGKHG